MSFSAWLRASTRTSAHARHCATLISGFSKYWQTSWGSSTRTKNPASTIALQNDRLARLAGMLDRLRDHRQTQLRGNEVDIPVRLDGGVAEALRLQQDLVPVALAESNDLVFHR